jgi:hypothetical protein
VQILYRLSIIKLTRFYKLCFFPISVLSWQNIGKVFDDGNWMALRLIAPGLNVLLPKTGIITYGIAITRAPCAIGLFQCGYLQH